MSARSWEICPRCLKNAQTNHEAAVAAVQKMYGRIPAEDFEEAEKKLKPVDPEEFRTFRENYEIYGAQTGLITLSYSGECQDCDLQFSFLETRIMDL